jgi:hypothetical protein
MPVKLKSFLPVLAVSLAFVPAAHILAQTDSQSDAEMTGTSHPEKLNDTIDATVQPTPQQHYVKPSPAVPMPAPTDTTTYSNTYVPYNPSNPPTLQPRPSGDHYVAPSGTYSQADPHAFVDSDINSGVVTAVRTGPNELPIGTRITALLDTPISTRITPAGAHFTATLATPVMHDGRVLLPIGTLISGRVTEIHGGRRISGASAIRLQPDNLVLPDHATYRLNAEVTDLDHFKDSHVNSEGTITNTGNKAAGAAAIGLTTGSAAVAGALIGGGVGAVVGAGIGAGVGTVWWLRQDHQQTLPQGTEIVFNLNDSLVIGPGMASAAY